MDIHALFGNVHPGTAIAAEVQYIKVLEPIEFELSMFGSQPCPFDLQSKSIGFGISRA
jgi:hypothetical protein